MNATLFRREPLHVFLAEGSINRGSGRRSMKLESSRMRSPINGPRSLAECYACPGRIKWDGNHFRGNGKGDGFRSAKATNVDEPERAEPLIKPPIIIFDDADDVATYVRLQDAEYHFEPEDLPSSLHAIYDSEGRPLWSEHGR